MAEHPNPSRGVVIGRVSTQMQVHEGTSLGTQFATGIGWAAARNIEVPPEYQIAEAGVTGKRYWTRAGMQTAISLIERKMARYLICETVDRAARRAKIAHQIIERIWDADGVLIANGIEFRRDDPQAPILVGLFFGLAEWDYKNTRRKLDTGRRNHALGRDPDHPYRKAMQRGTPPYGLYIPTEADILRGTYPNGLLGRHVIVQGDADQARRLGIVRELYGMYDQGLPLIDLIHWLQRMGVRTPRGNDRWADKTLDYLLTNEVYAGAGKIFKSEGRFDEAREIDRGLNADYRVPTDPETWQDLLPVVLYNPETGTWADAEPVVDPDLWQRVRDKREADEAERHGGGRLRYYLSHFGRCPVCGGRWKGTHIKNEYGDYDYYCCSGRYTAKGERQRGCSGSAFPYMRVATVEAAFLDVLEGVMRSPEHIAEAIAAYERQAYDGDTLRLEHDRLIHQKSTVLRKLDAATDSMAAAEDDDERESYRRNIERYKTELKTVKAALAEIEKRIVPRDEIAPKTRAAKLAQAIADVRLALTAGPEDDVSASDKAAALRSLIERVDIDEHGRIVVTFSGLSHIADLGIRITGRCVREDDQRSKYAPEFVADLLAEVARGERPTRDILRERGVPVTTFYRWRREGNLAEQPVEDTVPPVCALPKSNHFDLANNYGTPPGNAEIVCGRVIKDMPRDELIISSKAGYRMWPGPYGEWGSRKYIIASCDQSLKRMGLEYFDIFYSHRPDMETPLEETMAALDQLVRQGKALYAGVSSYSGAHFAEATRVVERMHLAPITIHQPYYNMLGRGIEWDLLPQTERAGTGVIAFCPLASGMLTDKYLGGDIPAESRAAQKWGAKWVEDNLNPERRAMLNGLNDMAKQRGQTLAQMALAWILRLPAVTSALIGASSVRQVEENVAALDNLAFSDEELKRIDELTRPRP